MVQTCFGIGEYFRDELVSELSKVPYYCVSFDESYNRVTKDEQIDVAVRPRPQS